jgi:hypothetical protein
MGSGGLPPAPTFFSYHDAVVRHFIAALQPHLRAVLAKREQTSSTHSHYLGR